MPRRHLPSPTRLPLLLVLFLTLCLVTLVLSISPTASAASGGTPQTSAGKRHPIKTPTNTATATSVPTNTPVLTSTPVAQGILAQDTFARASQAYWGTASDGHVWGADAATSAAFSIASNQGAIAGNGSPLTGVLGASGTDEQVLTSGQISAWGSSVNFGGIVRYRDTNNWYKAYVDGSSLIIQKKVSGATTILASVAYAASTNTSYTLRFQVKGSTLGARVWPTGSAEPSSWMASAADSSFASGYAGLRAQAASGGTVRYSSFVAYDLSQQGGQPANTPTATPKPTNTPAPTNTPGPTATPPTSTPTAMPTATNPPTAGAPSKLLWGANMDYRVASAASANKALGVSTVRIDANVSSNPDWQTDLATAKAQGWTPLLILRSFGIADRTTRISTNQGIVDAAVKIWGTDQGLYFEFGNEADLNGWDATTYTNEWNATMPPVISHAPSAKYGGPVNFQGNPAYIAYFVHNATRKPDFVSWHEYTCDSTASTKQTCLDNISHIPTHVNNTAAAIQANGDAVPPMAITEWNYSPYHIAADSMHTDQTFMDTWTTNLFNALISVKQYVFMSDQFNVDDQLPLVLNGTPTYQGTTFSNVYHTYYP